MADNPVQRSMDISLMAQCLGSVAKEKLLEDINGIALRIWSLDHSNGSASELVFSYIRSSVEVRDFAREESVRIRAKNAKSVWDDHLNGFKEYERSLAWKHHRENPQLDCDGAWYRAQDKIADIILRGEYEKVENPGFYLA